MIEMAEQTTPDKRSTGGSEETNAELSIVFSESSDYECESKSKLKLWPHILFWSLIILLIALIRVSSDARELNGKSGPSSKRKLIEDAWIADQVYAPLSQWLVDHVFYEMKFSANLISILGLMLSLLAYLLFINHCNYFKGKAPLYIYPLCAVLLFLSTVFDYADGKQARKSQYGSNVGALVDHGIDCIHGCMQTQMIVTTIQIGNKNQRLIALIFAGVFIGFWCNSMEIVWIKGTIERFVPWFDFILCIYLGVICPFIPINVFDKKLFKKINTNQQWFKKITLNHIIIGLLSLVPMYYVISTTVLLFTSSHSPGNFPHDYTFPDTAPMIGASTYQKVKLILYHMFYYMFTMGVIVFLLTRQRITAPNKWSFVEQYPYKCCWALFGFAFIPVFNMVAAYSGSSEEILVNGEPTNPPTYVSFLEVKPQTLSHATIILFSVLCYYVACNVLLWIVDYINTRRNEKDDSHDKENELSEVIKNASFVNINSKEFLNFLLLLSMIGFVSAIVGTFKDMMNDSPDKQIYWFGLPHFINPNPN